MPEKKATTLSPTYLMFEIMFPESRGFQSHLPTAVMHCLMRACGHLSNRLENTYPSIKDGVLLPFDCAVS